MGDRYHNMFKKKETITKKISKKLPWDQKIKLKNFDFFFFVQKMEQEVVYFRENCIVKSAFHKNKKTH